MMPPAPSQTTGRPKGDAPLPWPKPYDRLFIYYLKGRVPYGTLSDQAAFIGNWEEAGDTFLFFHTPADAAIEALLLQHPRLVLQDRYDMPYDEWQGEAPAAFKVGRLQVLPPWDPAAAAAMDHTILLDPGVVFGTGTHPTTRDCLTALQAAFDRRPVSRVFDIGTGTGLLALAAAKLGAGAVAAVDLNRLATVTARRNVRCNRMQRQILVVQGDALNFMDRPSDLVVSNIHYDVMRHLIAAPGFSGHRQFILSGLLRSQAREITYRLHRMGVRILGQWEQEGTWFTFHGETKGSSGTG